MAEAKTGPTGEDFETWAAQVEPERRRQEVPKLDAIFRAATGFAPVMWTGGIVGYGRYDYMYASGHGGTYFATGFAPRKARLSVYIMPGYADFGAILARLGKHSLGKSCLYFNKLADVDEAVLGELIEAGLEDLRTHWPV